jgi:hypothetical protein
MKIRSFYFLSILLLLDLSAHGQAALRRDDVVVEKVLPSVQKTPEFQITSGQTKRSRNQDWLEIEVEFATKAELIDELTFKYQVVLNGKLLVGDVTHVNIPKGREHYSVAYISPRTIERFMEGRSLTGASIENVRIEVSKQGQVLGEKSLKPSPIPNLPQVTGFVLNKMQTPFAPLYWDRYEAIKDASR